MTTEGVAAELAAACADVREAGSADMIADVPARYVAAPASIDEASALLRAAAGLGLTVVPRGAGSRMRWGNPPSGCDLIIDTRLLDHVLEHAAGDLVVRVQAGVRRKQLAAVLEAAGQRLALDPPGSDGTVGGMLATNAAGPLRFRYGAPRDLLIGITVVLSDGKVARSGGKVVKNVAGYDLGKLFAGSFGTLGLITEVTFRLHPLPKEAVFLSKACPDPESAAQTVQMISDSPLTPSAIELFWPSADAPLRVGALLEGDEASVATRSGRLGSLLQLDPGELRSLLAARGELAGEEPDKGDLGNSAGLSELADDGAAVGPFSLARPLAGGRELPGDGTLVRVAFWVGQLATVLTAIRAAGAANRVGPAIRGSAGAGILEISLAPESDAVSVTAFVADLRTALAALGDGVVPSVASAVVVYAPAAVREAVDVWGPAPSLPLMQAVKYQFDPEHRMAPGRLAGGI